MASSGHDETREEGQDELHRTSVSVTNLQTALAVDSELLRMAVRRVFRDSNGRASQIDVAVVDDATIHDLNRRHLEHDYPTDVLSYPLEDSAELLHGEIVVSAETAVRNAPDYGWSGDEELCLYVVHGALHLAGYRDKTDDEKRSMQAAEQSVLRDLGIQSPECSLLAPKEEECSPLAPREESRLAERDDHTGRRTARG